MYYFEEHKLYEEGQLKNTYKSMKARARRKLASAFPVALTSWIMAVLCSVSSPLYNLFFYLGHDESAGEFPIPVISDILAALGKVVRGNFFIMFPGGFVLVALLPLVIGLVIRFVLTSAICPFVRVPSVKDPSPREMLEQIRLLYPIVSQEHPCDTPASLFPLVSILGTAAGIMYAMYLDDPTVLDSSVLEWIFAIVMMILFGALLCLPHFIYFAIPMAFFRQPVYTAPSLLEAVDAEEIRLNQEQDAETYYATLRENIIKAKEKTLEYRTKQLIDQGGLDASPFYRRARLEARLKLMGHPCPEEYFDLSTAVFSGWYDMRTGEKLYRHKDKLVNQHGEEVSLVWAEP